MDLFRAELELTRLLPECSQVRVLGEVRGGGGGGGVREGYLSIYLSDLSAEDRKTDGHVWGGAGDDPPSSRVFSDRGVCVGGGEGRMGEGGMGVCLSICLSICLISLLKTGKLMDAFRAGLEMTRLIQSVLR